MEHRRVAAACPAGGGMARYGDRRTPPGRSRAILNWKKLPLPPGEGGTKRRVRAAYGLMRRPHPSPLPEGPEGEGVESRRALAGGLAAALAAGLAMLLLRSTLQVRSAPERLLEWMLLFVPLDAFEAALQRFGFNAKRYALYLGILVTLGLLAWLGTVALRRRWSLPVLLGIGLGLWLFTMLVVMPLTSAGLFALGLLEGKRVTILGYLGVGLVYATALTLARVFLLASRADRAPDDGLPGAGLTLPPRR